nr:hypothetical protein [Pyrobaculum sp.]
MIYMLAAGLSLRAFGFLEDVNHPKFYGALALLGVGAAVIWIFTERAVTPRGRGASGR